MKVNSNALVFYGGGLCDSAGYYIAEFAQNFKRQALFNKVYVGFYSFRCLVYSEFVKEWSDSLYEQAQKSSGGFFGTARETNLADSKKPELMKNAIKICKSHNIKWIFLAGGDGSARQMSEIVDSFEKAGIHFVFTMPMTIDGIEGGYSFGINAAVRVSLERIKDCVSTSLRTLDGNKFPALTVILQGRNRNDILANVLDKLDKMDRIGDFTKDEIDIIAIPTGCDWRKDGGGRLVPKYIGESDYEMYSKPKLILVSEGAKFPKKGKNIEKYTQVKTRVSIVAHESQMNGLTTDADRHDIDVMIDRSMDIIRKNMKSKKSYTIVVNPENFDMYCEGPHYFAERNPRKGLHPKLAPSLDECLKKYYP